MFRTNLYKSFSKKFVVHQRSVVKKLFSTYVRYMSTERFFFIESVATKYPNMTWKVCLTKGNRTWNLAKVKKTTNFVWTSIVAWLYSLISVAFSNGTTENLNGLVQKAPRLKLTYHHLFRGSFDVKTSTVDLLN